ncbi:Beta-lactamase-like [Syntrophomonas zehnderi OL-4]|uniref:Beta-lactamase-like n=1 Tax=Syntrophomonas zehnderi OL-4 TaxID=690567 RepID=A0A0E4GBP7_9FIRM|nr:MBL fold metallo-hydrolase [Syntrophomonas zehnderi]CFX53271.1 Beta-lactamase-like [Syntrophomonas zehnderi OL-4]
MLIDLNPNIKVVRPEGQAVFPYSNSIFIDDKVKTLIDAGSGGKAYTDIAPEKIELLLLSHYHFDHTNGISFFENARKMVGEEELWAFTDENQFLRSSGYFRWEELIGSPKEESWSKSIHLPDDVPSRPGFQHWEMEVFKDGQEFIVGETRFNAIHTPGHSPGHYAFFFPDQKILFSADLDISPRGPWYGGEFSDFDDIVQSINKMTALKAETLVSSHRRVFYGQVEQLLHDYLKVALDRENRILDCLDLPCSLDDLAERDMAFESLPKTSHNIFWAKMMILKHLQRLIKMRQVKHLGNYRYVRTD